MDRALEDQLAAAFPRLYRFSAYCACHDGWFELIWRLSARLEALIAQEPDEDQAEYAASEIKEKWGQLSFALWNYTDEMLEATLAALGESRQVCEECGAPGTLLRDGGWVLTRCPAHAPAGSQPIEFRS
jgi:hypothetical protein